MGYTDTFKEILNYKLHITVLLSVVISQFIGTVTVSFHSLKIVILPMIFALILVTLFYLEKRITWIDKKTVKNLH